MKKKQYKQKWQQIDEQLNQSVAQINVKKYIKPNYNQKKIIYQNKPVINQKINKASYQNVTYYNNTQYTSDGQNHYEEEEQDQSNQQQDIQNIHDHSEQDQKQESQEENQDQINNQEFEEEQNQEQNLEEQPSQNQNQNQMEYQVIKTYWKNKNQLKNQLENQHQQDAIQTLTKYRPDIDGLKAIAIFLVIVFNTWPDLLIGGFIGVDIFFVISGYLITRTILKQQFSNTFSYTQFYSNRIKRIYPALILVMTVVLVTGCSKFMARSIQVMTKTLFASTMFFGNLQIMTAQPTQFDPNMKSNPYFHLWSLGIQQQFYMIWPLIIAMVVYCLNRTKGTLFFIFFTLTSFYINIKFVKINKNLSLYFPFSRFWQMGIGSMIAYSNFKFKDRQVSDIVSMLSLIAILIAGLLVAQNSYYPGYWALLPTFCTALILATQKSIINRYILSSKPFVFLGKISYSLYLWHWPLLVFLRFVYPLETISRLSNPFVILGVGFILSVITHFLIQNQIRYKKQAFVTIILILLMLSIGFYAFHVNKHIKTISQTSKENYLQKIKSQNEQKLKKYGINTNDRGIDRAYIDRSNRLKIIDQNPNSNSKQPYNQLKTYDSGLTRGNANRNNDFNSQQSIQITNEQSTRYNPPPPRPQSNPPGTPIVVPSQSTQMKFPPQEFDVYQKSIRPTQGDYYIKNGIKIPNSSKNKKRQPPTFRKIKYSTTLDPDGGLTKLLLQKKVVKGSPYFMEGTQVFHYFQIANQGKQNELFVIGDSHAQNINYRLKYLYQQSKKNNQLQNFPTVITMIDRNQPFWPCRNFYHVVMKYIKERKPQRVFFMHRWLKYFNFGTAKSPPYTQLNSPCNEGKRYADKSFNDFEKLLKVYVDAMKEIKNLGVKVYVAAIDPQDVEFDPRFMIDQNSIIQSKLKPVKMSEFRNKEPNNQIIKLFEKQLSDAGVSLVYLSDNYCFQDICQVTMPSGYSTFKDGTHFSTGFTKYWAKAVDFLTQF